MVKHYEALLGKRPDFDGIKEPIAFFIPRFDAVVSFKEHANGRDPKKVNLAKYASGKLLDYLRRMRDYGFIGNYGGIVDIVRYILNYESSQVNLLWIPKNSCTFLKSYFLQFESDEARKKIQKNLFHESCQDAFGLSYDDFCYAEQKDTISIIRHPIERVVSCYLDKFVKPLLNNNVFEDFIRGHIVSAQKLIGLPLPDLQRSITFSEFVFYISKQPQWSYDAHWRPQAHFLRSFPRVKVLTIGQFYDEYGIVENPHKFNTNVSYGGRFNPDNELTGDLADLLPRQIGQTEVGLYNNFIAKHHFMILSDIYSEDLALYSKCFERS